MSACPVVAVKLQDGTICVINESDFDPSIHEKVSPEMPAAVEAAQLPLAEPPVVPAEPEESPEARARREAAESAVAVRRMELEVMTKADLTELITRMGVREVREKTTKADLVAGILDLEAFRRQEAEMRG